MATPESSNPWTPLETKDCSQGFCSIYCPQWCYIVFPPPPPFEYDDSSGSPTFSPLVIAIIGVLASAFLLVSYYAIISKFCGASLCRRRRQQQRHPRRDEEWHILLTVGLDRASINKITTCRYKIGDGSVGCSDCSVCLSEFQEDESLRVLPKCGHAFHVQCIDTWLKSHSNCPLCRAGIAFVSPGPPLLPEGVRCDETVVAIGGSDEGRENERGQRMRRSFSTDSFHQSRIEVNIDDRIETADHEILVSGSSSRLSGGEYSKGRSSGLHCVGLVPMRRSVSSGRLGHSVLPV